MADKQNAAKKRKHHFAAKLTNQTCAAKLRKVLMTWHALTNNDGGYLMIFSLHEFTSIPFEIQISN